MLQLQCQFPTQLFFFPSNRAPKVLGKSQNQHSSRPMSAKVSKSSGLCLPACKCLSADSQWLWVHCRVMFSQKNNENTAGVSTGFNSLSATLHLCNYLSGLVMVQSVGTVASRTGCAASVASGVTCDHKETSSLETREQELMPWSHRWQPYKPQASIICLCEVPQTAS